jgi:hypothetical protein
MAGMWEFACGNTFGALAFTSYGGFWISFACIFIPWFNVAGAYTDKAELANALGHYLICILAVDFTNVRLVYIHLFHDDWHTSFFGRFFRTLFHAYDGFLVSCYWMVFR